MKKILVVAAAIAAAVWLWDGLAAEALEQRGSVEVNPWLHTIEWRSDVDVSGDMAGFALLGASIASNAMCEPTAARAPGFGWHLTLLSRQGSPIASCWSLL